LLVAILALHFSQKKADNRMSYGWGRAEAVGPSFLKFVAL
jgi:Co/Zn/Cd efflux system component